MTAGMSLSMGYAAYLNHGALQLPFDHSLQIMYGFMGLNLITYLVMVPFVWDYKLGQSLVIVAFSFYGVYNLVYGLAIAGIVKW